MYRKVLLPAVEMYLALRPLCQVRNGLPHYTSLSHDQEPTLYLIFRGAIAQFEQIGEDVTVARSGKLHAEVKGFTGRGNKRLRARYPPGHIVGKTSFFLHGEEGLVDHKMLPMLQVSSRMSGYAEIWELSRSSWDKMPEDLKSIMEGLMLFQLADDRQHSLLIECFPLKLVSRVPFAEAWLQRRWREQWLQRSWLRWRRAVSEEKLDVGRKEVVVALASTRWLRVSQELGRRQETARQRASQERMVAFVKDFLLRSARRKLHQVFRCWRYAARSAGHRAGLAWRRGHRWAHLRTGFQAWLRLVDYERCRRVRMSQVRRSALGLAIFRLGRAAEHRAELQDLFRLRCAFGGWRSHSEAAHELSSLRHCCKALYSWRGILGGLTEKTAHKSDPGVYPSRRTDDTSVLHMEEPTDATPLAGGLESGRAPASPRAQRLVKRVDLLISRLQRPQAASKPSRNDYAVAQDPRLDDLGPEVDGIKAYDSPHQAYLVKQRAILDADGTRLYQQLFFHGDPSLDAYPGAPPPLSWEADTGVSICIVAVLVLTAAANLIFCCPRRGGQRAPPMQAPADSATAQLAPNSKGSERVDTLALTGLRGLAALHVAFGHYIAGSPIHVDLIGGASMSFFYLLSGFVMTLGYAKDLVAGGESSRIADFNKRRFWRNRFARLFPMYVLTNALFFMMQRIFIKEHSLSFLSSPYWDFNLVLTALGLNMWVFPITVWLPSGSQIELPSNFVTWTVQTMAVFYIVFPSMLSWLQNVQRRRLMVHLLFWLQAVTFMSLVCIGLFWLNNFEWSYWSARAWPLSRIPVFAMGCLAAVERIHGGGHLTAFCRLPRRCSAESEGARWGWRATALGVGYLLVLALGITINSVPLKDFRLQQLREGLVRASWEAFVPLLFIDLILALTQCGNNGPLAKLCRSKPMEFMGDIAMAFYMVHFMVLGLGTSLCARFFPSKGPTPMYAATPWWLLGTCFVVALFFGAFVTEEPSVTAVSMVPDSLLRNSNSQVPASLGVRRLVASEECRLPASSG
eukprot:s810_g11.t3